MLVGAVVLAVAVTVAFAVLAHRRDWRWTGLPADPGDGTPAVPPRPAKTLWDWLQLLIVPLVLALAAFALNAAQSDRDRKQDERRALQERRAADDRAREETLRNYLQQISNLITEHGLGSSSTHGRNTRATRALARTLTLTALRRLDTERKTLVLRFLYEDDLISSTVTWLPYEGGGGLGRDIVRGPQVPLHGADLRNVVVPDYLNSRSGPGNHHRYAITSADLSGADLRHADFRDGLLRGVSLERADLRGADFTGAVISGASFDFSCLSDVRFARVIARPPIEGASGADFVSTQGRHVDFSRARMEQADFGGAVLTDVNLGGARTSGTDWPGGWTSSGLRLNRAKADQLCAGLLR